jgi:uncharacterized protein YceK
MKKLLLLSILLLVLSGCSTVVKDPGNVDDCHTEMRYRFGFIYWTGEWGYAILPTTVCE